MRKAIASILATVLWAAPALPAAAGPVVRSSPGTASSVVVPTVGGLSLGAEPSAATPALPDASFQAGSLALGLAAILPGTQEGAATLALPAVAPIGTQADALIPPGSLAETGPILLAEPSRGSEAAGQGAATTATTAEAPALELLGAAGDALRRRAAEPNVDVARASVEQGWSLQAALFDAWNAPRASGPDAEAPAPAPAKGWLGARALSALGRLLPWRRSVTPASVSEEETDEPAAPAAPKPSAPERPRWIWRMLGSVPLLGRLVPAGWSGRAPPPELPPELRRDDYGGPPAANLTFSEQVRYGLGWGFNLTGLAALYHWLARPAIEAVPWQLWIPEGWLNTTGRVELMTQMGPEQVSAMVAHSPTAFLLWEVPRMAGWEEVIFRLLGFGLIFLPLMGLRHFGPWAAKRLEGLKDSHLAGALRGFASFLGWLGTKAFWIAAGVTAWNFAISHLATWGLHPYTFIAHFSAGAILSYVAYRSRGLIAPFVAHSFVNIAGILLLVAFPLWMGVDPGATVRVIAGIFFAVALGYNWLAARKDRKAALAGLEPVSAPSGLAKRAPRIVLQALVLMLAFMLPRWAPALRTPTPAAPETPVPAKVTLPGRMMIIPAPRPNLTTTEIARMAKPATVMVMLPKSYGSGFIVSKEGLVVTNAHVVDDAAQVKIRLDTGMIVDAKVVAVNAKKDIALIQLPAAEPAGWPFLQFGNPAHLQDGDMVVSVGHPLGHPFHVAEGRINQARGKNNDYVFNWFTHSAEINRGSSGGPLLNGQGEVIGINNAGIPGTEIHYAIDGRVAMTGIAIYRSKGTISPNYTGIVVDVKDGSALGQGVKIERVRPGTPAEAAGLRAGDVILSVNGAPLNGPPRLSVAKFRRALTDRVPGEKVTLQVRRETEDSTEVVAVTVTLGGESDRPVPLWERFIGDRVSPPGLILPPPGVGPEQSTMGGLPAERFGVAQTPDADNRGLWLYDDWTLR